MNLTVTEMESTLVCFRCGKEKPRSEFYDLKHCKYCKTCRHEIYILNKEHVRKTQKKYNDTHKEELKVQRRLHPEWNHTYYANHKEKWGVKT